RALGGKDEGLAHADRRGGRATARGRPRGRFTPRAKRYAGEGTALYRCAAARQEPAQSHRVAAPWRITVQARARGGLRATLLRAAAGAALSPVAAAARCSSPGPQTQRRNRA